MFGYKNFLRGLVIIFFLREYRVLLICKDMLTTQVLT